MAARGGHLALLQWAQQNGCPWDRFACGRAAARDGHLETLQWLAAAGDDYGVREYLVISETAYEAAAGGHHHVLDYLKEWIVPFAWEMAVPFVAARHGHLATLQWLRANGCPWSKPVCLRWAAHEATDGHDFVSEEVRLKIRDEVREWVRAQPAIGGDAAVDENDTEEEELALDVKVILTPSAIFH